jgi:hypothetical protein
VLHGFADSEKDAFGCSVVIASLGERIIVAKHGDEKKSY